VRLSERFLSIQGEPNPIGALAYFIRLSGCNLQCSWCDTKDLIDQVTEELSPALLSEIIESYQTIVITGGEPLLQIDDIVELVGLNHNKSFYIETNGTLDGLPLVKYRNVWFTVSPKPQTNYHIHKSFDFTNRKLFKFVLNPNEIEKDPTELNMILSKFSKEFIYLMPLTEKDSDIIEDHKKLAAIAIRNHVSLASRLHILFKFK
jgi:7-carboxy-7-deazaguanine synthase